jgi:hypothetical protein
MTWKLKCLHAPEHIKFANIFCIILSWYVGCKTSHLLNNSPEPLKSIL